MQTIAIVNEKGGTGKTTTAVNLSAALGKLGRRVLLVDLDGQAASSRWFGVEEDHRLADALIRGGGMEPLAEVSPGVDLAPASGKLDSVAHELRPTQGGRLRKVLAEHADRYDLALIDCPPSLGNRLIGNALLAASHVIVPVEPSILALDGLRILLTTLEDVRDGFDHPIQLIGVLVCRYEPRTRLSRLVLGELHRALPGKVFRTLIRETVRMQECPASGGSILRYAAASPAAQDYLAMAQELLDGGPKPAEAVEGAEADLAAVPEVTEAERMTIAEFRGKARVVGVASPGQTRSPSALTEPARPEAAETADDPAAEAAAADATPAGPAVAPVAQVVAEEEEAPAAAADPEAVPAAAGGGEHRNDNQPRMAGPTPVEPADEPGGEPFANMPSVVPAAAGLAAVAALPSAAVVAAVAAIDATVPPTAMAAAPAADAVAGAAPSCGVDDPPAPAEPAPSRDIHAPAPADDVPAATPAGPAAAGDGEAEPAVRAAPAWHSPSHASGVGAARPGQACTAASAAGMSRPGPGAVALATGPAPAATPGADRPAAGRGKRRSHKRLIAASAGSLLLWVAVVAWIVVRGTSPAPRAASAAGDLAASPGRAGSAGLVAVATDDKPPASQPATNGRQSPREPAPPLGIEPPPKEIASAGPAHRPTAPTTPSARSVNAGAPVAAVAPTALPPVRPSPALSAVPAMPAVPAVPSRAIVPADLPAPAQPSGREEAAPRPQRAHAVRTARAAGEPTGEPTAESADEPANRPSPAAAAAGPATAPAIAPAEPPTTQPQGDLPMKYRRAPEGYHLDCVLQSSAGNLAVINGKTVRAGSSVGQAKVVQIQSLSVEMELQGERFTLGVGTRGGK